MVPARLTVLLSLWLLFLINLGFAISKEVSKTNYDQPCVDCTICPSLCQKLSPPPPGFPLYGAPPPLPPSQSSGYPLYGAPPPPPKAKGNCPPVVQCCGVGTGTLPPPPPNTYTYLPNHSYSTFPSCYNIIPFISIVILLVSFTVLF
ncbi:hypothetical protein ACOSP7_030118 [Xanthoceras sorbifolium]